MASGLPGIDEILRSQVLRTKAGSGSQGTRGTSQNPPSADYVFPSFADILSEADLADEDERSHTVDSQQESLRTFNVATNKAPSSSPTPPLRPSYASVPTSAKHSTEKAEGVEAETEAGTRPRSPVAGAHDLESTIDASSVRFLLSTYITLFWYLRISIAAWISLIGLSFILPKFIKAIKWGIIKVLDGLDWSLLKLITVGRWCTFLSVVGLATAMGMTGVLGAYFLIPSAKLSVTLTADDQHGIPSSGSKRTRNSQREWRSSLTNMNKTPANLRICFVALMIMPCILTLFRVPMFRIIIPAEALAGVAFIWVLLKKMLALSI